MNKLNNNPLFRTGSFPKLFTELRKKMSERNIDVSTVHFSNGADITFTEISTDVFKWAATITIGKAEMFDSMYMHTEDSIQEADEEILAEIFSHVDKVAKKLKVSVIYVKYDTSFSNHKDYLLKYNYQNFAVYPGLDYPQKLIGVDVTHKRENIYYKELVEGTLKKKIEVLNEAKKAVENAKDELDATFICQKPLMGQHSVNIPFYYEGFEGRVEILYGREVELILYRSKESTLLLGGEIVTKEFVQSSGEIPKKFYDLIMSAVESQGLLLLTNPPKKHFKEYCSKNSMSYICDDLFELLSSEMEPKDIELKIMSEDDAIKKGYEGIQCIFFMDRYFVSDRATKTAEMYHNIEDAIEKFDSLCQELERKKYEEKIKRIEDVKQDFLNALKE